MTIEKANHKWTKLLDKDDLGLEDLSLVIILNTRLESTDRYHNAKSELVYDAFIGLEFFFDKDMHTYNIYFAGHRTSWTMRAIVENLFIEKEISGPSEEQNK